MLKINKIESAIYDINDAIFQEFCNHYIYYKEAPNTIEPIGSVIGKDKTRTGTPDCFFIAKDGSLNFMEYTTKQKDKSGKELYKKLRNDISDCFNTVKTGLNYNEIDKVILFFTSRLEYEHRKELEKHCKSFNPDCILELVGIRELANAVMDYPVLGSQYLNLPIDTGEIQTPSEYVKEYEKSSLSTPISNEFIGKEEEIKYGLEQLNKKDIFIIHGQTGTGKTRYAIELCQKFYKANSSFKMLCIGNKGIDAWNDIQEYIRSDIDYIVMVDDANRKSSNYKWLLQLFLKDRKGKLKVVVTVRDYALGQVRKISDDYSYSEIQIKPATKEEIANVVTSKDFNVTNPHGVERIQYLAKGNMRIAVMCAKLAKEKNTIFSLNDGTQIFEKYFSTVFNEIEELNDRKALISLSIITFFGTLNIEKDLYSSDKFESLPLQADEFKEYCYFFHEKEIVDLYEDNNVKISDQIFATFIFYHVVVKNKLIKFDYFLDNFFEYTNKHNESISSVVSTYGYEYVKAQLYPSFKKKWNEVQKEVDVAYDFIDNYWFIIPEEVLEFFSREIEEKETGLTNEYNFTYKENDYNLDHKTIFKISSRFKQIELKHFKNAIELQFHYAIKCPEKMPELMYYINTFSFDRKWDLGIGIQQSLFDHIFENIKDNNYKSIYQEILNNIIPKFLDTEHRDTTSDGKSFTLYTIHLYETDFLRKFRDEIWDYITIECKSDWQKMLSILDRIPILNYKESKEVWKSELEKIQDLLQKYSDRESLHDCLFVFSIFDKFEIIKYPIRKDLIDYFEESNKYRLVFLINNGFRLSKKGISHREAEKIKEREFNKYCNEYNYENYINLFKQIDSLIKYDSENQEWKYERAISLILGNLVKENPELFIKIFEYVLENSSYNHLDTLSILRNYFDNDFTKTIDFIRIIKKASKKYPLLWYHYHRLIHNEIVVKQYSSLPNIINRCFILKLVYVNTFLYFFKSNLFSHLTKSFKNVDNYFYLYDISFIKKYSIYLPIRILYKKLFKIFYRKIVKEKIRLRINEYFYLLTLRIKEISNELLLEMYFKSLENDSSFDYENDILKAFTERDSKTIVKYLNTLNKGSKIQYSNNFDNLNFIWELPNYSEIILSIINYLTSENIFRINDNLALSLFNKTNGDSTDKKERFMQNFIIQYHSDEEKMKFIFEVIANNYQDKQIDYIKLLLSNNEDIEQFEKLSFFPSFSMSSSLIPKLENEKSKLIKIKELMQELKLIDHKNYILQEIKYVDQRIKREREFEFEHDRIYGY